MPTCCQMLFSAAGVRFTVPQHDSAQQFLYTDRKIFSILYS